MFSASRFSVSVYVVFASLLFMALLSSPASAQTLTLTECTEAEFRQAVAQAPSETTINFGGDCEITLTEENSPATVGDEGGPEAIAIDKDLTIDGGTHDVTISGGGEVGIFHNKRSQTTFTTLTLKNLTLANGAGRNFKVQNGDGFGGAGSGGGAVYNESKLVVEGVTFKDNRAFDAGGAIYSIGSFPVTASVTDSTFIDNEAACGGICSTPGGGGAIAVAAGGATEIENSVFRGNTAFGRGASGGAVLARRSNRATETGPVSISGSTFEENKALTVTRSDQSRQGGGAVFVFNRVLTIAESTFDGNESNAVGLDKNPGGLNIQQYGGAVVVEGFAPTPETLRRTEISDSTFTGNSASGPVSYGGALYVLRAPTSISNVTFTGNEAERTGAIDNSGAAVEITDSEIEDNTATGTKDEGPLTVGGVGTQSQGTELEPGVGTEATTTFARTKVSNNVNGNCATAPVGNIVDNGGNSETPGASCGFNGATRVEESRPDTTDDEYEFEAGTTLSVPAPGVLENDSDPEGEAMSAELVGEPRRGAVVLEADGSFEYTPEEGAIADTFTYRVKSPDGLRQSRVATVKVGVASEIVVNATDDGVDSGDNACTLREAAISADLNTASGGGPRECAAGSENDTITFDLPDDAEITLGGGQIEILSAMTIDGSTAKNLTIEGDGERRVFSVTGGPAQINDLTITKGADTEPAGVGIGGGGIFNSNLARLTLTNVLVTGNTSATIGGGVRSIGDLTVKKSSFTGNTAESDGGAIHNDFGALIVEASTLSGNKSTDGLGGGIFSTTEDVSEIEDPLTVSTIRNSTISGNTAGSGGGILNENGLAVIENSTITNNEAPPKVRACRASGTTSPARRSRPRSSPKTKAPTWTPAKTRTPSSRTATISSEAATPPEAKTTHSTKPGIK
ncbi:MAG: Ig-like domain-containing protein [Rubrobacteraceae bacterium]